jgi:uncharacterized protein (TIGR03083 family)
LAINETDLRDLDPFDIFDAEAARLDRFFSSLDENGWRQPSRCDGWSIRDVLAHLAGEEMYNHACLDGDIEGFFARLETEGVRGLGGFNEWCVRQRAETPVKEVLDEWRVANAETRRRMRSLGRDGELLTSAGPYPAGLQAFHLASEYATHADDVGAPVQSDEEPGRTQWRARVGRFVSREQGAPVEIEEIDGTYRVRLGANSAELSAPDFVEATVARFPADHPLDRRLRAALVCLA